MVSDPIDDRYEELRAMKAAAILKRIAAEFDEALKVKDAHGQMERLARWARKWGDNLLGIAHAAAEKEDV